VKIFTSYFGNAKLRKTDIVLIGISHKVPDWLDLDGRILDLAPSPKMIRYAKSNWDAYVESYRAIVRRLHAPSIIGQIRAVSGGRDCALLCWEKSARRCHRKLVGRWLSRFGKLEDDGGHWIVREWKDVDAVDNQLGLFPALAGEESKVQ